MRGMHSKRVKKSLGFRVFSFIVNALFYYVIIDGFLKYVLGVI